MDAGLFTKMLSDKSVTDLKKLKYKYPQADLAEFVSLLKGSFYHALPLKDFDGGQMVYLESVAQVRLSAARVLLTPQDSSPMASRRWRRRSSRRFPLSRLTHPVTASGRYSTVMHLRMSQKNGFTP